MEITARDVSLAQTKKGVRPTVEDYIAHIDYAVKLIGVDHMGIGLDLSYGEITTEEEGNNTGASIPMYVGHLHSTRGRLND